jgi:hypothetical protein
VVVKTDLDPEARVKFFPKSQEVTSLECDLTVCIARDTAAIFAALFRRNALAACHDNLVELGLAKGRVSLKPGLLLAPVNIRPKSLKTLPTEKVNTGTLQNPTPMPSIAKCREHFRWREKGCKRR